MKNLNYQLKQLCQNNRDGSYSTQHNRERILTLAADQLHALGYRGLDARSLKPKHVEALVKHWQVGDISIGTQKNRMSALRWWAQKVDRQNVIARSNDFYGIPERSFVTNVSKAKDLNSEALGRIKDDYVRLSLMLQQAFGLRREEAIKIQPHYADRGDHLLLKDSWTKGGKARSIPIRTDSQRKILNRASRLAGGGSLIPPARNYVQQLRVYERHTSNAGLSKLHGLRHAYAQNRYVELTGWQCPATGGPVLKTLTHEQKISDRQVRLTISKELGHEREQITTVYLGR
ncbi:phage integrase N-terminal domain-containing protein [Congregibacter litoralis]|uniref:Phage integrase n=1 Tax=Congregibacter litoralis KT71 TaxID=314285 RepID=V7HV64_9GAMM|nr:phage integrase N-terminal domain-containing protein [Congregibacter litoralis]ESZ89427.1 Phage integrase [Congregibacter litoralis KT71]